MLIPNPDKCIIDPRKLSEYCLSQEHPRGKHKAKVFTQKLGLQAKDSHYLIGKIKEALLLNDAQPGFKDQFGRRYTVDFQLTTDVGSATLRTAWIIRKAEEFPRFLTCFVVPE